MILHLWHLFGEFSDQVCICALEKLDITCKAMAQTCNVPKIRAHTHTRTHTYTQTHTHTHTYTHTHTHTHTHFFEIYKRFWRWTLSMFGGLRQVLFSGICNLKKINDIRLFFKFRKLQKMLVTKCRSCLFCICLSNLFRSAQSNLSGFL